MSEVKKSPVSDGEWYCRRDPEEERFYEIFFGICWKCRISWASASETEKAFTEEVARVTYEHDKANRQGVRRRVFGRLLRPDFVLDPHAEPHAEMSGEGQRAPDRKFRLPAWLFRCFFALHDLYHKIPHRLRRLILLLPGGVGVGAEGEACVVVAQHTGDRFHIHPVLQGQGRKGMPLRYNNDKRKKP